MTSCPACACGAAVRAVHLGTVSGLRKCEAASHACRLRRRAGAVAIVAHARQGGPTGGGRAVRAAPPPRSAAWGAGRRQTGSTVRRSKGVIVYSVPRRARCGGPRVWGPGGRAPRVAGGGLGRPGRQGLAPAGVWRPVAGAECAGSAEPRTRDQFREGEARVPLRAAPRRGRLGSAAAPRAQPVLRSARLGRNGACGPRRLGVQRRRCRPRAGRPPVTGRHLPGGAGRVGARPGRARPGPAPRALRPSLAPAPDRAAAPYRTAPRAPATSEARN